MRVLVVDNYDSFVYNLVQYLAQLGVECTVWRNDAPELAGAEALAGFDAVLVSPGPSTPERAGFSVDVVRRCADARLPLLGVCLGHQAIGVAWGATVDRAPELLHGKTSRVFHSGGGVLAGLPDPFTATRYHSLSIVPETIPEGDFEVTGRTESGIVMGMRHRELPIEGVQFHPESVLTEGGHRMLANWLGQAGFRVPKSRVDELERTMRELTKALA
ncbi:aminodeoxychorismate/anthranilate synthase component II [Actinokineospora auranticolor]|uniref:Para-aminobenzoate synthetase component 2 n=1 Tax=Actinokineospora auranticolor TaxID=155976 RepID=A0A2S6GS99_9PSEU|nr:aminodeoxychorismate/anthranilate synthase component II [Actinokineospora auranticolor]PPK68122.1 para-aminobenzoate synthetase component 2 [Actinokineospora auranticolor]